MTLGLPVSDVSRGGVDPAPPRAIWHGIEPIAGHTLGIFIEFFAGGAHKWKAVFLDQLEKTARANIVRGNARLQIEPDIARIAALLGQILEDVEPQLAAFHQFDAAAAHSLVEDFRGAAAQHAAGIRGVRHAGCPGDQLAVHEDRLDHHLVINVGGGNIGIVHVELIAVIDAGILRVILDDLFHCVLAAGRKAQMSRSAENRCAVRLVETGHAFAALYDDWRGAHLLQRDATFFGDIHQPMNKHLVANRIDRHTSLQCQSAYRCSTMLR